MKAMLQHDWLRDTWKVWIYDRGGPAGPRRIYQIPEVGVEDDPSRFLTSRLPLMVEAAERQIAPTFEIPEDYLGAIVEAALEERGLVAPHSAAERHLADATKVRDELLGLVSRGVTIRPPS